MNGFRDIKTLPALRGTGPPISSLPFHHKMLHDTMDKNIYGLGVGISIVIDILSNLPFRGVGVVYLPLVPYLMRCINCL